MIQKASQRLMALYLGWQCGLDRVIKGQRDDVAEALVRATSIVVFLDLAHGVTKVGVTQENQLLQGLADFTNVPFSVRIA